MKVLIILFTLLFMTLNSVSSASMWVSMSASQPVKTVAETSPPCHNPHDMQMPLDDVQQVTETFKLCDMDDCGCEHLNTAKVPDDIHPYPTVFIRPAMQLVVVALRIPLPFLPVNDRPPRIMPA